MLTSRPDFSSPPLIETALGIQFREVDRFQSTHFGLFYSSLFDRYPFVEERPRLVPIFESFPRLPTIPGLKFEALPKPQRVFFKDAEDAAELVQLQPDRFGFNWRKPTDGERVYPRYSENGKKFLDEFQRFIAFCGKWDLGDISPNLCEVVYVNHLFPESGESASELFAKVFAGVTWNASGSLGLPEAAEFNRVFVIDKDRGRLYAEASIAQDKARGDFIVFKMTARALHRAADDLDESLAIAHDWAVRGFLELTNEQIRKQRWGQVP